MGKESVYFRCRDSLLLLFLLEISLLSSEEYSLLILHSAQCSQEKYSNALGAMLSEQTVMMEQCHS